jgi:hypothetical protein
MKLAPSKGPDRVGFSFPSPEAESRFLFRNTMFPTNLEIRRRDQGTQGF